MSNWPPISIEILIHVLLDMWLSEPMLSDPYAADIAAHCR